MYMIAYFILHIYFIFCLFSHTNMSLKIYLRSKCTKKYEYIDLYLLFANQTVVNS
jgi:hypothetical protein